MDDRSFKVTLIKALEHRANADWKFGTDKMWEVIMTLPRCNVYLQDVSGIHIVQFFIYKHQ